MDSLSTFPAERIVLFVAPQQPEEGLDGVDADRLRAVFGLPVDRVEVRAVEPSGCAGGGR
jgi:hypothetical protein